MKPNELYNYMMNTEYNKSGFDLDWKIEIDKNEKKIRVLFQDSLSIQDWIVNFLSFIPCIKIPLIYAYGWKKTYDSVKALIMEELIRKINRHKEYSVEISGHSYGGAMSVICGIDLYNMTKIKADIITFGSPKPLILFLSKFIAKGRLGNVIQYAHKSDMVTYCPPLIGFHNVKVKRIGKFNIVNLFNPMEYHLIYGDESLYEEE